MRCGLCRYICRGINEMQAVCVYMEGLMRCRLCRYMWGVNKM